jgi:hypothetical protein
MKTCGLFEVHKFHIPNTILNKPVYLIPWGDVHRSSPMCHEEKWKEFLAWARSKKDAYFLGVGDYDDLVSTSEREGLAGARLHDSTRQTVEQIYRQHTDRLVKEISFMKGRCLGLIEGNHYGVFQNGTTTTQRMCEALDCKYLGCSAFIQLTMDRRGGTTAIDLWVHHGMGAARLVGGSLNRVQQMAEAAEADIYLMGHDHKKSVATITRLKLNHTGSSLRLSHRKALLIRTGSFLRGYVPGKVSYVADAMMNPTDLGCVKIELTPRREDTKETPDINYIDLHASI